MRLNINAICTRHYDDAIMDSIASQITSLTIVYPTVHSDADQSKHQSSASLAFVWEIHRWPVNFPHKWPVTRKMFPFDDVIMEYDQLYMLHERSIMHVVYTLELTINAKYLSWHFLRVFALSTERHFRQRFLCIARKNKLMHVGMFIHLHVDSPWYVARFEFLKSRFEVYFCSK